MNGGCCFELCLILQVMSEKQISDQTETQPNTPDRERLSARSRARELPINVI